MTDYKLIAFDMDGTLLNSSKKLSQNTIDTVKKCIQTGKYIVFSTGRCLPELKEFTDLLPEVQYLICTSGSFVYDPRSSQEIYSCALSIDVCQKILAQVQDMDVMIHIMGLKSIVQKDKIPCMQDYHMEAYQPMYYQVTTPVEDIQAFYQQNPMPVHKLNLYFRTEEDRQMVRERLKTLNLNIVDAETTSLECSAIGATKGEGLTKLCEFLQIPLEKTIAVGDADNDLEILAAAGLAVAMGNANDHVKKIADVIVADNNHEGCVEAMEKYLLNTK